jgi:alkanesulfonate monooxygenase SsuD/methylene tetrahydromethanopterin reductase-like flavin-dependent oxidoreductase (luciferase family)
MDFGVGYFPTHDGMDPAALARLVEDSGQDAVFFAEHTHIPASRESAWPDGGELPSKYWHCYDLFVALTAAPAATSTLRVGSGTLGMPCDPAALERVARAGVRRANHWLPSGCRSTVERALDQWTTAINQFTGG